jgi:hypothetical protein
MNHNHRRDGEMRRALIALFAVGGLAVLAGGCSSGSSSTMATTAGEPSGTPDGVVEFSEGAVAAGIGFSWGSGTLTYKNQQYPIKAEGLSVGEVGITRASAKGNVYNLKRLEDFSGNYTSVGMGATVGGGVGGLLMKNQNGVEIQLVSTTQGANVKIAASGVRLSLK